jgi:hypothetical protein
MTSSDTMSPSALLVRAEVVEVDELVQLAVRVLLRT